VKVELAPAPRELILGKWVNCDKCMVHRMEFHPDGTVLYEGDWPEPLKGTWHFAEDDFLVLTPQPLCTEVPLPTGEVHVAFPSGAFVFNGDGPGGLKKPIGGRFERPNRPGAPQESAEQRREVLPQENNVGQTKAALIQRFGPPSGGWREDASTMTILYKRSGGTLYLSFDKQQGEWICVRSNWVPDRC
jgi:hypothetical protein